jgi:hypothetical protein
MFFILKYEGKATSAIPDSPVMEVLDKFSELFFSFLGPSKAYIKNKN